MIQDEVELVKPTMALANAYLDYASELVADDPRLQSVVPSSEQELEALVALCALREQRGDDSTDNVRQTSYWLVRGGKEIIGDCRLRHTLTPSLGFLGGHVDYGIRPSERRKGYGTRILELIMAQARNMGITRLLITCRKDNLGSVRVIENNGGALENECLHPRTGKPILRYWIDL